MRKIVRVFQASLPLLLLALMVVAPDVALAAVPQDNILDDVIGRFKTQSATWEDKISGYAMSLFWTLNVISLAWGLGIQAISRADLPDVFSELFRHIMFTGFHYWLLLNGPYFSSLIIDSLRTAAGSAVGGNGTLGPSDIIDIGLNIAGKALDNFSAFSPIDSLGYIIISAIILISMALIAANMMIMLCAGWFLTYAGILFLGFGGGRWTSDMAINYYKTVLSVGASLFTMSLLIGIGQAVMNDFANAVSADAPVMEMFVCMILAIVLMLLVDKLPQMVAGITTGALGGGFQGFGAGTGIAAATAAAGMAIGAVGGMAAAAGAASSNIAGGVNAVREAASLADTQLGIGGNPMGEGGGLGGSEGGSGSSGGAESGGAEGGSRMSAGWIGQVGKNLAQATSAQAMSGFKEKMESALEKTFPGQVGDRLKEQNAELSAESSAAPTEGGAESGNSIGGATSDSSGMSPELQKFVEGKNA